MAFCVAAACSVPPRCSLEYLPTFISKVNMATNLITVDYGPDPHALGCVAPTLASVVQRSAFVYERVGPDYIPAVPDSPTVAQTRIAEWTRYVCGGDRNEFQKRLQFDEWDAQRIAGLAGSVQLTNCEELPEWAKLLHQILQSSHRLCTVSFDELYQRYPYLYRADPVPFEQPLTLWTEIGMLQVREQCPLLDKILTPAAIAQCGRLLLQRLSAISSKTFYVEFSLYRARSGWNSSSSGQERYLEFIHYLGQKALADILFHYPVLARMLCSRTLSWVQTTVEFINRVAADLADLKQVAGSEDDLGRVSSVAYGLSDSHNHGRVVFKVEFEDGSRLVYKPKSLGPDKAYYALLQWLNTEGVSTPMRVVRGLYREGYGWTECLDSAPCTSREEVERYFTRAGMLLCLTYILGGSDLHYQNVIACGEQPVIIDLETLFYPEVRPVESSTLDNASGRASSLFYDSVFRTNLLPRWFKNTSRSDTTSGFLGGSPNMKHIECYQWQNINSDCMQRSSSRLPVTASLNIVRMGEVEAESCEYIDCIVRGFREMYDLLSKRSRKLLADGGPLSWFRNLLYRIVFRDTQLYGNILEDITNPQFLRDGMDTSIRVDVLSRPLLQASVRPPTWQLIAEEHEALLRGDIPLLQFCADDRKLWSTIAPMSEDMFARTGYEEAHRRLRSMSIEDSDLQVAYIQNAFRAAEVKPTICSEPLTEINAHSLLADGDLIDEVITIAETIQARAIRARDETVSWVTRAYDPESARWQLQPMDFHLYDGQCGTAVFLAAVAKVTGDAGFRETAIGALRLAARATLRPAYLLRNGVGAGIGASSLIYGLVTGAQLLGDESFLFAAADAASLITPERISSISAPDILLGLAGCIVGLLALHRAKPELSYVAEAANLCGLRLLSLRVPYANDLRTWQGLIGPAPTGLAHGVSGIGYAFAVLWSQTGNEDFSEAAAEAFELENALQTKAHSAEMKRDSPALQTRWCSGMVGSALARLGAAQLTGEGKLHQSVVDAVDYISGEPLYSLDHPCCGNLGRTELFLNVPVSRSRDGQSYARAVSDAVVRRARASNGYRLGTDTNLYIPSFHQGMSGIGYQLLRTVHPELPSVLSWQ
jgi:type 2 lantibiotic biosynthesis protein LanM